MERATTAREAVQVMGKLAEEYGFVGDTQHDGAGEVVDTSTHIVLGGWVDVSAACFEATGLRPMPATPTTPTRLFDIVVFVVFVLYC
jgi:hypothetical protein